MTSTFSYRSSGNRNRKQIFRPSPMSFSRALLELYLIFGLVWSIAPTKVEAVCYPYPRFLNCLNQLPTKEELENLGMGSNVILGVVDADLRMDVPTQEDVYSVTSLQIQNSNIRSIAPYFFYDFSSGALEALVINTVNGSFQLDGQTLGKLENVIKSIRVNGYRIRDISYFAQLRQLNTLSLGRTQLTALPENFGTLLGRLINVDLSANELTTLPWDALARRIRNVDFQKIRLQDNSWHCDCTMQPILEVPDEYLDKIVGFHCATPKEVTGFTLREFRNADLCKKPAIEESVDPKSSSDDVLIPSGGHSDGTIAAGQSRPVGIHPGAESEGGGDSSAGMESGGTGEPANEVASAGLSTEVIVVIVAIVLVVLIVLIAAIVFKARQNSQRKQHQNTRKQPSQRSSSYCAVVEHPPTSRGASGTTVPKSGAVSSASNNYGRDGDHIERQPLAPGYRDNRL